VTLARSVAHLSSEMRTQHIMIQEMETIRNEIAQLRSHPLRMSSAGPSGVYGKTSRYQHRLDRDSCWQGAVPALTDPGRVKKLTSFFGDEPPLLRIFLKKLGYEVIDLNFRFQRFSLSVFSVEFQFFSQLNLIEFQKSAKILEDFVARQMNAPTFQSITVNIFHKIVTR
jgi:hypothetical protein